MEQIERIDYANGELDDVAVSSVTLFHMEQMSDGLWWIRLDREGADDLVFWLTAKGKITATMERD